MGLTCGLRGELRSGSPALWAAVRAGPLSDRALLAWLVPRVPPGAEAAWHSRQGSMDNCSSSVSGQAAASLAQFSENYELGKMDKATSFPLQRSTHSLHWSSGCRREGLEGPAVVSLAQEPAGPPVWWCFSADSGFGFGKTAVAARVALGQVAPRVGPLLTSCPLGELPVGRVCLLRCGDQLGSSPLGELPQRGPRLQVTDGTVHGR